MNSPSPDVVIVGGGIVGAACAWSLSQRGLQVLVVEAATIAAGATSEGMGHVVIMDDNEAEFALTRYSRQLWLETEFPADVEFRRTGTIWVAADEEEFAAVLRKHDWYSRRGVRTQVLDEKMLAGAEPNLRRGLLGALLVPDDCVLYAPCAARVLLERSGARVRENAPVTQVRSGSVVLASGEKIGCGTVVIANSCAAAKLVPGLDVRPKKGHLAITDRYPGFVHHQLVELGYIKSAHTSTVDSVAFNVQPRATGQVLLGSSRQLDDETRGIDWNLLARMIRRAEEYMPSLPDLSVIRTWTGFRAVTRDNLPLIGPTDTMPNILLATGHEGLGITTSLGTGELIAACVTGTQPPVPLASYLPSRFVQAAANG